MSHVCTKIAFIRNRDLYAVQNLVFNVAKYTTRFQRRDQSGFLVLNDYLFRW